MVIVAIVVLYNPDIDLLKRLYKSLYYQIDSIIFVDNSENELIRKNVQAWLNQLNSLNTNYLNLQKNYGIAYAHNRGIEFAKSLNADFVLLLDQDSALPNEMVNNLLDVYQSLVNGGHKVAAVGPSFLDEKTNEIAKIIYYEGLGVQKVIPDKSKNYERAHHIISSGSLIPTEVLDEVGGMKEVLYIDMVDIEWCIRAKRFGYSSYVAPKILMRHSIGDEYVSFGKRKINLHSDFRNYFIVRNSVYVSMYEKSSLNYKTAQLARVPLHILFYSYHSKRPIYSLGLLSKAVVDGIFKNMDKGHFGKNKCLSL